MLLKRPVQMLGFVAVVALASAQEVAAASLEVTATVPNACTVDSGDLQFGEYLSGGGSVQATGGFNVQCTAPASVLIALDGGLHNGQGNNTRAMSSPSSNDFLDYLLYQAPGFTTVWQPGDALEYPVVQGANQIQVNGLIDSQQFVAGGDYSDTVQITLTFN